MSGSYQQVVICGNLGKDPEVRSFANGGKVCNMTIATSEKWRDKSSGDQKERTEWHRVAVFSEGLVRICEQYLRKGSKVLLTGQLETRKWTDSNGQDKYSTEVVLRGFNSTLTMLDGKGEGGGQRDDQRDAGDKGAGYGNGQGGGFRNDLDDEIPFAPEVR